MKEACVVLDKEGKPIHWHLPGDRTSCAIPDSRSLWEVIWENRERLGGVAHSHPGSGVPGPSYEDVTTFAAIEAALGKRLDWWIITSDSFALYRWRGDHRLGYEMHPVVFGCPEQPMITGEPEWTEDLRTASYQREEKDDGRTSE